MPQMQYVVKARDDAGNLFEKTYPHTAPASLFGSAPDKQESKLFLHKLCTVYHKRILEAKPFRCVVCGEKAEDLVHQPYLYLHAAEPAVIDMPTPICEKPPCQTVARQQMQEMLRQVEDATQQDIADREIVSCATCGKTDSLQRCNNCKVTAYCSRECQKSHWKQHKPACQQAAAAR